MKVSSQELKQLKSDSSKTHKSVPSLLRETYFNTPPSKVLMKEEDLNKIRTDINRIGNNLNQIAREINSGIRSGWNSSFDSLNEQVKLLNHYYVLNYGIR
ncbi:MAG: plasmid mobilization relaxosome protein MobC [Bdellovibrionaceae bacterium]|nr:plasmid mobilization relaxosome protein MobC [Pseudobdellovibrionaceae bacterium]